MLGRSSVRRRQPGWGRGGSVEEGRPSGGCSPGGPGVWPSPAPRAIASASGRSSLRSTSDADLLDQLLDREGLQQERGGPRREHALDAGLRADGGDHEEGHLLEAREGPQRAQELLAVHVRHEHVADHAVGPEVGKRPERLGAARERVHLELRRAQRVLEQPADLRVVVRDDDPPGGAHGLTRRPLRDAACRRESANDGRPAAGVSTGRRSAASACESAERAR